MSTVFSKSEVHRYSRHFILPEFGARGQKALKAARVLCVGAGGLGSPAAMYLAAAGVGTLGVVDFDVVDLSNLQRQILHTTPDVGRSKLESARAHLLAMNPEIEVRPHAVRLTAENALPIFAQYDLVLDGTDTYATRYLINDACVLTGIPNVSASVFRFEGQLSVFGTKNGPCYRCLYPEPPPPGLVPSCGEGGILGVVTGVIGSLQATEVIKVIAGLGEPLIGRLLLFDALDMQFRTVVIRKNPACAVCGTSPSITSLIDYEEFCGLRVAAKDTARDLQPLEVHRRMKQGEPIVLLDVREPGEREVNQLDGALTIPLGELSERVGEVPTNKTVVVFCKVGERSLSAVTTLVQLGFTRVFNLEGGIEQWLDEVDDDQPHY